MSLIKKARNSVIPIRAQIDRISEQYAKDLCIELVLPSGLMFNRFDGFVDLESHTNGLVGGVATKEIISLTFFDYPNVTELPVIRSRWEKGTPYTYRIGLLGDTYVGGVSGKNDVGLRRFPDYANHFLDLLIDGRTIQ